MPERVYVQVRSVCDATCYMLPRAIIWPDGRVFTIEDVRSIRPDAASGGLRNCFTVMIRGQERTLFYEQYRNPPPCRHGRWYVEHS